MLRRFFAIVRHQAPSKSRNYVSRSHYRPLQPCFKSHGSSKFQCSQSFIHTTAVASKKPSKSSKSDSSQKSVENLIHFFDQEILEFLNIEGFKNELEDLLHAQQIFYATHVNIRSASAIDEIEVEFEGDTFPLREIADISKADPKRVIIDSSSIPQATKSIMQALTGKKNLNLNPQQEGTRIYVPIPKVTK